MCIQDVGAILVILLVYLRAIQDGLCPFSMFSRHAGPLWPKAEGYLSPVLIISFSRRILPLFAFARSTSGFWLLSILTSPGTAVDLHKTKDKFIYRVGLSLCSRFLVSLEFFASAFSLVLGLSRRAMDIC